MFTEGIRCLALSDGLLRRVRRKKHLIRAVFRAVAFSVLFGLVYLMRSNEVRNDRRSNRVLWSNVFDEDNSTSLNDTYYDTDTASIEEENSELSMKVAESGLFLFFYIFGVLYMFLCIAIVCDELFVPALEIIAGPKHFDLSMDVAGATLMAAGGSAPELFTAFVGTFQESEVGFGTIVGSAVFNVLFVIAMCSFFAKETLTLTWWPLSRDCTWYILSLVMLTIFSGVISPGKIEIWEAVVQLSIYLGYVIFMKYNQSIYRCISSKLNIKEKTEYHTCPTQFRAGLVNVLLGKKSHLEKFGYKMMINMSGDVEALFKKIDVSGDGYIDGDELSSLLERLGFNADEDFLTQIMEDLDRNKDGRIDLKDFTRWFLTNEKKIKAELKTFFDNYDKDDNGKITFDELKPLLIDLGAKNPSEEIMREALSEIYIEGGENEISYKEFEAWYLESPFWTSRKEKVCECADEVSGTLFDSLKPPKDGGLKDFIRWIVLLPIIFCLTFTVPDVRNPKKSKFCFITFILSISWIGILTFFMVQWATIIGNTLGIPLFIMGLTFLAAGTSVPDLLTSVIVAKMGQGDMAVSSSIGSNIFDVTFGLPFPWLVYCIYPSTPSFVTMGTESIFINILVLLIMVLTVVILIHCNGWVLSNRLGVMMLVLYLIYLTQAILLEYF